jgi:hypothetical protein
MGTPLKILESEVRHRVTKVDLLTKALGVASYSGLMVHGDIGELES